MADKQFLKGVVAGALCACPWPSEAVSVAYAKAGYAGSSILSDVAVTQKIKYLEDMIDEEYLEEVDEESLKEGLYTGLLYGVGDPYTRYYTEAEYDAEIKETEGAYSGIGISITQNTEGGVLVVTCYEGGPGRSGRNERGRCDQRRKRN